MGRAKGRGKRGVLGGESLNEDYFCKIPIIKQYTKLYLTNFWSDKLLTTTIANSMPTNLQAEIFK